MLRSKDIARHLEPTGITRTVLASLALMQNRSGRITSWYVLINYIVTIPDQGPSIWQTHKTLRPFKDKGWPLYNWMCEIIPSGIASGHHSFDASAAPSTTPAESAPPTPAAPGTEEDLIMKGPTASSTIPVDASTTSMSQSPSLSSFLQSGLADENSNRITTSTSYMRPPPSNPSSKGKRCLAEITDGNPVVTSNFKELPYAQTVSSSVKTGPATKKRKENATVESAATMLMDDAMAIATTWSSSHHARARVADAPQDPMLVTLVGAVSHLAGSIERTMQPAEERMSTKKQQAIRILEDEHNDLPIEQRITLLCHIGEDDYLADVLTLVQKDHRSAYIKDLLQNHPSPHSLSSASNFNDHV